MTAPGAFLLCSKSAILAEIRDSVVDIRFTASGHVPAHKLLHLFIAFWRSNNMPEPGHGKLRCM